jgi:hypothetical protein
MAGRKRRDRRGAASVEAVVVIPTLLVVLFAIRFVAQRHRIANEALAAARECAFRFATEGCTRVPPGCERVLGRPADERHVGSAPVPELGSVLRVPLVSDLPVLKQAIDALLGSRVTARGTGSVVDATFAPGTGLAVGGRVFLPCNVPARAGSSDEVVREVFDVAVRKFFE